MHLPPSSEQIIRGAVRAVHSRQLLLHLVHGVSVGLLTGALVYVLWAFFGEPRWLGVLLPGIVGGLLRWSRLRTTAWSPAHRIDVALDLKDRVASAAEFSTLAERRDIFSLQIHDAADRVGNLSVARVVPWAWRRDALLIGIALGLVLIGQWPHGAGAAQAMAVPVPPALHQEAETLADQFEELAEHVAESGHEELDQMLEELQKQVEDMADAGSDVASGLQTLGRIRNALEEAVAAMDLAVDQALLAALAEALQRSDPTRSAAKALADGDLAQAADALDQAAAEAADPANRFTEQAQALANPMEQLAQRAAEADRPALSEMLSAMADGVRSGDAQACSDALQQQAAVSRQTEARRRLAESLKGQLQKLAEARNRMTGAYCEACMQGTGACASVAGGACASQGMSRVQREDATSTSPSDAAGMGTHDAPFGEATELDGTRIEEQLSGQLGTGPSAFTLELAPQFEQQASREYREVYATYQRLSEQALEQEPIPETHEGIIRTYFESIRPVD